MLVICRSFGSTKNKNPAVANNNKSPCIWPLQTIARSYSKLHLQPRIWWEYVSAYFMCFQISSRPCMPNHMHHIYMRMPLRQCLNLNLSHLGTAQQIINWPHSIILAWVFGALVASDVAASSNKQTLWLNHYSVCHWVITGTTSICLCLKMIHAGIHCWFVVCANESEPNLEAYWPLIYFHSSSTSILPGAKESINERSNLRHTKKLRTHTSNSRVHSLPFSQQQFKLQASHLNILFNLQFM